MNSTSSAIISFFISQVINLLFYASWISLLLFIPSTSFHFIFFLFLHPTFLFLFTSFLSISIASFLSEEDEYELDTFILFWTICFHHFCCLFLFYQWISVWLMKGLLWICVYMSIHTCVCVCDVGGTILSLVAFAAAISFVRSYIFLPNSISIGRIVKHFRMKW